jgi:hypothetical protein
MKAQPARVKTSPTQHRLKVEPVEYELGMRFHVESESDPSLPYTVDLSMNGGAGCCTCASYRCRNAKAVQQALLEHKPLLDMLWQSAYQCKHLKAASLYWMSVALPAVIAAHQQQDRT